MARQYKSYEEDFKKTVVKLYDKRKYKVSMHFFVRYLSFGINLIKIRT